MQENVGQKPDTKYRASMVSNAKYTVLQWQAIRSEALGWFHEASYTLTCKSQPNAIWIFQK